MTQPCKLRHLARLQAYGGDAVCSLVPTFATSGRRMARLAYPRIFAWSLCGAAAAAWLACTPAHPTVSPAGTGSVTGDHGFTVVSALAAHRQGTASIESATAFFLTDMATNCDEATPSNSVPYLVQTLFGLVQSTTDDALQLGTIPVAQNPNNATYPDGGTRLVIASVGLKYLDGGMDWAQDGQLTIADVGADHVSGTMSLDLATINGGPYPLQASFVAALCPKLVVGL